MTAIALFPLSHKQELALTFMWEFYMENDQLPPERLMCEAMGWKSKNSAAEMIEALKRKGFIEGNAAQKNRFTALFHAEQKRFTETKG